MADSYATVQDLQSRWRPLSGAEQVRAGVLLQDAAARIDAYAAPADPPTDVRVRLIVSCDMVKRAMLAGDGPALTQESQTRGPFTGQFTYANPTGDMYLTKAEKVLLGGRQRAGNVSILTAAVGGDDESDPGTD